MKKIYICSPVRGDENNLQHLKENLAKAATYSHYVFSQGYFPICSQVYIESATGLSEARNPNDRARLLELGLEMLLMCDELWVFGRREGQESSGMKAEIAKARELKMPVHYNPAYLPTELNQKIYKAI
jgi:hypothetical protein